jgi:hypothetical protein
MNATEPTRPKPTAIKRLLRWGLVVLVPLSLVGGVFQTYLYWRDLVDERPTPPLTIWGLSTYRERFIKEAVLEYSTLSNFRVSEVYDQTSKMMEAKYPYTEEHHYFVWEHSANSARNHKSLHERAISYLLVEEPSSSFEHIPHIREGEKFQEELEFLMAMNIAQESGLPEDYALALELFPKVKKQLNLTKEEEYLAAVIESKLHFHSKKELPAAMIETEKELEQFVRKATKLSHREYLLYWDAMISLKTMVHGEEIAGEVVKKFMSGEIFSPLTATTNTNHVFGDRFVDILIGNGRLFPFEDYAQLRVDYYNKLGVMITDKKAEALVILANQQKGYGSRDFAYQYFEEALAYYNKNNYSQDLEDSKKVINAHVSYLNMLIKDEKHTKALEAIKPLEDCHCKYSLDREYGLLFDLYITKFMILEDNNLSDQMDKLFITYITNYWDEYRYYDSFSSISDHLASQRVNADNYIFELPVEFRDLYFVEEYIDKLMDEGRLADAEIITQYLQDLIKKDDRLDSTMIDVMASLNQHRIYARQGGKPNFVETWHKFQRYQAINHDFKSERMFIHFPIVNFLNSYHPENKETFDALMAMFDYCPEEYDFNYEFLLSSAYLRMLMDHPTLLSNEQFLYLLEDLENISLQELSIPFSSTGFSLDLLVHRAKILGNEEEIPALYEAIIEDHTNQSVMNHSYLYILRTELAGYLEQQGRFEEALEQINLAEQHHLATNFRLLPEDFPPALPKMYEEW